MVKRILAYIRQLLSEVPDSGREYTRGARETLENVEEFITDLMWEEGVDEDEEPGLD